MSTRLALLPLLVAGALSLPQATHAEVRADPLLSVDQNRTEIVEGLVAKWKDHLAASKEKDLKQTLMGLRADKLLAVSLAQDQKQFAALLEKDNFLPMKQASPAEAGAQAETTHAKALGEVNKDVVYTPITPCRVFDTRPANPLVAGVARSFATQGALSSQGGAAAGCGIPAGAVSVMMQLTNEFPPAAGFLIGGAEGTAGGGIMVYAAGSQITVSTAMPLNTTNGRFALQANNANTQLIGDVVGYFAPPSNGNGLRVVQTTGSLPDAPNIINGSANNSASGQAATVAGGGIGRNICFDPPTGQQNRPCGNRALEDFATVGGGSVNLASGAGSTVAGGFTNTASGSDSTVAGGQFNTASGSDSTVAGGQFNTASGSDSTIAGGQSNVASDAWSTVAGGSSNTASGIGSTVAGGSQNTASGSHSFVAGQRGVARSDGMFVWSDSRNFVFDPVALGLFGSSVGDPAPANNTFIVRATGGVDFVTGINGSTGVVTTSCSIAPSGTGWTCASDRALKEAIQVVQPKSVLARLMQMPVSTWSIKGEKRRQMGPMAQDFYQAFGLGDTDKAINSIDAQGVAFAAIQGLNQKLAEESKAKDAKLNAQRKEISAQASELAALKRKLQAIEKRLGL